MATPIGTNVVTAISRRHIMPEIIDVIYNSNPLFFRIHKGNKKMVQGGTHIEVPFMHSRFNVGGSYEGFDVLDVSPADTIKNGAWDWKQYYVPVSVDGRTLIKTDSPEAIANHISLYFAQANMEMVENLATGLWSDGTNAKDIDGLEMAVDDGGVQANYGGLVRATNTFLNATDDSTSATLTLPTLQSLFGNVSEGGRHPSIIVSRQEQYNRYWNLNVSAQTYSQGPMGYDEQLASAGFTNLLFNGVPWVVDSHVPDGPNSSNSGIYMLNEDYFYWVVSPRADFYLEDFQAPITQDAMTAKLLFAGNFICTNPSRQGKLTNISA